MSKTFNSAWVLHCDTCDMNSNIRYGSKEAKHQLQTLLNNREIIQKVYDLSHNELPFLSLSDTGEEDGILRFLDRHKPHEVTIARWYDPRDKEVITAIEEVSGSSMDGFKVTTNRQEITMLISNGRDCCEDWGYFMSEDDLESFVGVTLYNVRLDDTMLKPVSFEIDTSYGGGIMFVTLDTSAGPLQFVAYNCHNGYYGHSATVTSEQLKTETYL